MLVAQLAQVALRVNSLTREMLEHGRSMHGELFAQNGDRLARQVAGHKQPGFGFYQTPLYL
jgi:hypothetical protein